MKRIIFPFACVMPLLAIFNLTQPINSEIREGKDYALFFAVERYDSVNSFRNLDGLIGECEALAADLTDLYGFETKVIKNPTLREIDTELAAWQAWSFGPNDQLFVFFSGHGEFIKSRSQGYFIPKDGKPSTVDIFERRWFSLLDLRRVVSGIGCKHILLAVDACKSGAIDDRLIFKDPNEAWEAPSKASSDRRNQEILDELRNRSRIFMTSGAIENTLHPSPFVRSFREAFATRGGPDEILRPRDIVEYWKSYNLTAQFGEFENHEPGGTFIFVYQPKIPAKSEKKEEQKPKEEPKPIVLTPEEITRRDFWAADSLNTRIAFENFLAKYPNGPNDVEARRRIAHFDKQEEDWKLAEKTNTPLAYQTYLAFWPAGNHAEEATVRATPDNALTNSSFYDPFSNKMILVKGGTFIMGEKENKEKLGAYPHDVEISSFWLSKYEVTNSQFCSFLNDPGNKIEAEDVSSWIDLESEYGYEDNQCQIIQRNNRFEVKSGYENHPVHMIDWEIANAYCLWLSEKTGKWYRLPSEAEWEYAAGNGTRATTFSWGNESGWFSKKVGNLADETYNRVYPSGYISSKPQYFHNYNDSYALTAPVGSFSPNDFGLYDMTGNVREYCADFKNGYYYRISPRKDPKGPIIGNDYQTRVFRGGSCVDKPEYCKVQYRYQYILPTSDYSFNGFRVARSE